MLEGPLGNIAQRVHIERATPRGSSVEAREAREWQTKPALGTEEEEVAREAVLRVRRHRLPQVVSVGTRNGGKTGTLAQGMEGVGRTRNVPGVTGRREVLLEAMPLAVGIHSSQEGAGAAPARATGGEEVAEEGEGDGKMGGDGSGDNAVRGGVLGAQAAVETMTNAETLHQQSHGGASGGGGRAVLMDKDVVMRQRGATRTKSSGEDRPRQGQGAGVRSGTAARKRTDGQPPEVEGEGSLVEGSAAARSGGVEA